MKAESLDTVLRYLVLVIQAIVAFIAVIKYPAYKNTPLKYIVVILIYCAVTEIIGSLNIYKNNNNVLIYNIFNIVYFLFFYYAFWRSLISKKVQELDNHWCRNIWFCQFHKSFFSEFYN